MDTLNQSNRSNLKLILEGIIDDCGISQETWELIKVLKGYSSAYKVFLTIKDTDQFNYFLKPQRFGDLEFSVNYLKEKIRKENKFEYGTQSCGDIILDMLYSISIKKHYGAELDFKNKPIIPKNSTTLNKQDKISTNAIYEKSPSNQINLPENQSILIGIISTFVVIGITANIFLQQAINKTNNILLEDKQRKEYLQQQKQVE